MTRPLSLTLAGKLYHDFCRDVLRREEQMQVEMEALKGAVEGTVRNEIGGVGVGIGMRDGGERGGRRVHAGYAARSNDPEELAARAVNVLYGDLR